MQDLSQTLGGGRYCLFGAALIAMGCGGSQGAAAPPTKAPAPSSAASTGSAAPASTKAQGSPLTDNAEVAFRASFSRTEITLPWNAFGVATGNREVAGGDTGLLVRIANADKAWDAVGARTSRIMVDGDFDLRGHFQEFSAAGNGSAKLMVLGTTSRQDAAFVERIQIDGKNLVKFGGDVGGSLENWGFAPFDAATGDLRLARKDGVLHAYSRSNGIAEWTEFAKPVPAPSTMPRALKFGVKLSAEAHRSAQVRWTELTVDGQVVGSEP